MMKGVDLKVYGTAPNCSLLVSADEVNSGVQVIIDENAKLKQRSAELAAQVELINKAWLCPYPECVMEELNEAINKAPAQCLSEHDREVAARAVLASIESVNGYVTVSQVPSRDFAAGWNGAVKGIEMHANKIKSGEVEL